MKISQEYLIWMENPLIANGVKVFRAIGVIKNSDFPENGMRLGKIYISAGSPFQVLTSWNNTSLDSRR
jgi:hypothetical protein